MNIIINGIPYIYPKKTISYDDISMLLYNKVVMGLSIVYRGPKNGDSRREGSLWGDRSVSIEYGMCFAAMYTGNA